MYETLVVKGKFAEQDGRNNFVGNTLSSGSWKDGGFGLEKSSPR